MSLRVGLLTSGGDCQGLNPAMRGVAKGLYEARDDIEILGFLDGYHGLMFGNYRRMRPSDFSGILDLGGTIIGTSRQPFKIVHDPLYPDDDESITRLEAMIQTYNDLQMDALVILGGNGTVKTAHLLSENGCNILTLPKTIDNDLWGSEPTFGFQSAVNIATRVIDGIHSTASSHGRVFIIEIMGHRVGWLALYSGVASGADVILIPEIPYDLKYVMKALNQRRKENKRFSIIVVAEGAITQEEAKMSKKELAEKRAEKNFVSVAYELAHNLNEFMAQEVRVAVPGHYQRGGSPSPFDRLITTMIGAHAAELILEGRFGYMVGIEGMLPVEVPLEDVAGKLKVVDLDNPVIKAARQTGICFGDM